MKQVLVLLMLVVTRFTLDLAPGVFHHEKVVFQNISREYFFQLPKTFSGTPVPLIFILHGGGKGDGKDLSKRTRYMELGDKLGYISCFPNGVNSQWNDGRGVTFRGADGNENVDDVGYISSLMDIFIKAKVADPNRIHVTGVSNGGMMSWRLGCELSGRIAALAPIIANMPLNIQRKCSPERPLPLLVMNGTDDALVPFAGGHVTIMRKPYGEIASTVESLGTFVRINGCKGLPAINDIKDRVPNDGSTVQRWHWSKCEDSAEIQAYHVINGGHNLPGSKAGFLVKTLLGTINQDIIMEEVVTNFLLRHRIKP